MHLLVIGQLNSEITEAIEIAKRKHVKVFFVASIEEALRSIREGRSADIVLIDIRFDIGLIAKAFTEERINTNIIAYGLNVSPKEAVAAIKAGAKEFLTLPPDEKLIAALLETISDDNKPLIYKSSAMQQVMTIAEKVAKSDANILITGSSGTGKEVLAHYIHNNSNRSSKPFIRINCAAIPENLIESELFGHEKGAFTGAISRRIGKFEESNDGTLLLDEISEMDLKLQAKLLRAIQEKEIDRLGGSSPVKVNLRVIATSNRDLQQAINKGTFREDLYFRLNIINLELPCLRDRKEDIKELANFFVKKYSTSNNLPLKTLSLEAISELELYNWAGNIRELENTIHRAVLLSNNQQIAPSDLMLKKSISSLNNDNLENQLIFNTVNYCLGDLNQAANILGISIANLATKLKLYTSEIKS